MRKKIILLIVCVIFGVSVYFFTQSSSMSTNEPVYIAVVGPMGRANGKAMRQGVILYGDQINKQGGINGRKVKFIFRDDQNKPKQAEQIAQEFAKKNNVHLVLGHYDSATSASAGIIYKRNGIPAITASASLESVIRDNEWYFRTIPGNTLESKLTASYMLNIFSFYKGISLSEIMYKKIPVNIIFSKDNYGISLFKNFEKIAKRFNIEIKKKWEWDHEKSSTEQIERITKELYAIDNPGVIYFATGAAECLGVITALKDAGRTDPIIVSAHLAINFFDKLKLYSKEWEIPGYYSDGIYFITPFMLSLSGVKGFEFAKQFNEKYKKEPEVVAACYYDAVHVAVQAIKKSGIHGKKHIREDRRNIRKVLASFYNEKRGVQGVTGLIWFDTTGSVRREYALGRWLKQTSIPFFVQYDQSNENIHDILKGYLNGDVKIFKDLVMSSTQIVYVNVENFNLLDIDKKKSEFGATFRLRFRYPSFFDDPSKVSVTSPLKFTNALTPIVLEKPLLEKAEKGVTTKIFQVQGRFKTNFDSDRFSFLGRERELFIHFYHFTQLYDNLIYIPGNSASGELDQTSDNRSTAQFFCYSDILSKKTTLGLRKNFDSNFRLNYSRFNIKVIPVASKIR